MTWRAPFSLLCALATALPAVRAQDPARPSLTGSLRGGYWSSTRDLDRRRPLGAAMVWLKETAPVFGGATIVAEGWAALRGPPSSAHGTWELREAFLAASLGPVDLRVGRQIIAWGRADGVNPTGIFAAEDLTLLTPDDVDRRLGATAAVGTYYAGGVALSAVWVPEFRGHRIPLARDAGASFDRKKPEWPGNQWALRADRTGGAVDWSVSLFRGLDLTPDVSPTATSGRIAVRHHSVRVAGADVATNVGRFGLRAEGAYVDTEDDAGTDPFIKNPFLFAVVGGDRTFDGRLTLNLQYLVRGVAHFHVLRDTSSAESGAIAAQESVLSDQTRRIVHGASMRVSCKWLRETLETELAGVAFVGPRGLALRPKVTYAATDRTTILAGAEVFRGDDASLFRLLRPNSAVYLEVRWGFKR